jgi:16S rRNA processing protein RimM
MIERFVVGLLGSPFGVTGRIKVISPSGETEHLLPLTKACLRQGDSEKEYQVEEVSPSPLTIKFAGIDSPEAVKALKGAEILADRAHAAPLDKDEFYIEDLRGLKVYAVPEVSTGDAGLVGEISDIVEGGGAFLAEIILVSGEKKLVPFRNEFFGSVDPKAGRAELLVRWILD